MHKKILVIATPRTGSTALTATMVSLYRLTNQQEFFNPQSMVIGTLYNKGLANTEQRLESVLNFLKNQQNWVIKLHPQHLFHFVHQRLVTEDRKGEDSLYQPLIRHFGDLVDISNHHCYLYRRDFKNQVRSLSIANSTNIFNPDRDPYQPVVVPDSEIIRSQSDVLQDFRMIKAMYTHRPGKVMALEDISSQLVWGAQKGVAYPAYQNVQGNFDLIQDFDVEQEVFGIKRGGHCTPHPSI